MSYSTVDGSPLIAIGGDASLFGGPGFPAATPTTLDAANEACHMIGHIVTDDGASHTIDTTGSSSFGWRTGATTFSNAGTTVKVGLATVDAATGPVTRATNVADVVTLSVSKSLVGNGLGIATNSWQTHVPDAGTLTVANGDLLAFVIQMTARVTDSVLVSTSTAATSYQRPVVTAFVGGAYSASIAVPNCVITFSDGHLGWIAGGSVWGTTLTTQTWNSGSATKEYGNYILRPYPMKIYGIIAAFNVTADCDLVLYSDPLGTPFAEKTLSVDTNQTQVAGQRWSQFLFPAPFTAKANQPLAAIFKPGGSNVAAQYKTYNAATHAKTEIGGQNIYAVSRASGAFAAVNSNKDKFGIGFLVDAFSQENSGLINSESLIG